MGIRKRILERQALSESEVLSYLDQTVERTEAAWGKDYIYSVWAREARDRKIEQYRNGEVIAVLPNPMLIHTETAAGTTKTPCIPTGTF